ncbi:AAA family ATPase [Paenibacillus cellulositrophicus]|uniref:AAA family ATPase n=1 Tax=Paenibacillus cellulositrophicus TaxID=562959 RepID=UPI00203EA53F|nr:AAA family ATPase [Paenibacillus cellulositrophicus]MCM2996255.1 AAA family ATPase [Paenibacillus cellulositrophicus]
MLDARSLYLRSVMLRREEVPSFRAYPFSLPAVHDFHSLSFQKPVTFIVGENGSGKSTLLEGMAVAWGFNPEGGTINFSFETMSSHSDLHRYMRLVRGVVRPKDGFFFRAESYYNVATNIDQLDADMDVPLPLIRDSYGGKSLHEQSHGESFFATFMNRFGGRGLYLMDEPEAALSPLKQLSMLSRIHQLVKKRSQFIIATHSPILMSYPYAEIWLLDDQGMRPVKLEDTDHYVITRKMMESPGQMLDILLEEDPE